jgi:hypothetical protein
MTATSILISERFAPEDVQTAVDSFVDADTRAPDAITWTPEEVDVLRDQLIAWRDEAGAL